jgi:hypothetical protein
MYTIKAIRGFLLSIAFFFDCKFDSFLMTMYIYVPFYRGKLILFYRKDYANY